MQILLNILYALGLVLVLPLAVYRLLFQGRYRRGIGQRFGAAPRRSDGPPAVWIHAVSLGEVNAAARLVKLFEQQLPTWDVRISTTTDTGYDRAVTLYGAHRVFWYPLDFSWAVRRALGRINPNMIVLVELEVWPNLIEQARRRSIPIAVINGRITSERSMKRFAWPVVRSIARRMFGQLSAVCAQDDTYAQRFRQLGVPAECVHTVGSVKFDNAHIADHIDGQGQLATAMGIDTDRPLLAAGSTGPGEEAIILDAYQHIRKARHEHLQLAIVPRKPERFDEVAGIIRQRGYACVRRSTHADGTATDATENTDPVYLVDTMGELRKIYSLATVVFVGRTLVPMGGSDLMEVAALAKPIIVGPSLENFADVADRLHRARALQTVHDAKELAAECTKLLDDPDEARRMGSAGREVIRTGTGATMRTFEHLCELVGMRADTTGHTVATAAIATEQTRRQ